MERPTAAALRGLRWAAALVALLLVPAAAGAQTRVTSGLVAYYPFSEGSGPLVYDRSPSAPHQDLVFEGGVAWLGAPNGATLSGGRVGGQEPAAGLIDALRASGAATFEMWIDPANLSQDGPARILGVDVGPSSGEYDYVFGQDERDVQVRLQHTGKGAGLHPRLTTTDQFLATDLVHLVHTYDGSTERLYVDGVQHPTTVASAGNFTNWSDGRLLSIGNTSTLERSWSGVVRTVAIYERALSAGEVSQNFQAGADVPLASGVPIRVDAGFDDATPSAPGLPLLQASLRGSVDDPDASGPIASLWSQVSGPTPVVFADATAPETTVDLPGAGTYVFELSASDEIRQTSDRVTVVVPTQTSAAPVNLHPADGSLAAPLSPLLEIDCPPTAPEAGRFLIASDATFQTVLYDTGASPTEVCGHVVTAVLAGPTEHWWSARQRDGAGVWSDWSTPTRFTTGVAEAFFTLSFQDGVAGYTGTRDADIRGDFQNPQQAVFEWNQGAQDVLRTGRRPAGEPDEMYRSLLRFDLSGVDPDAIGHAQIELTGWMHGSASLFFHGATSFYALQTAWGEGEGLFGSPPQAGEVSWTYSAYAQPWSVPGAADPGVDRGSAPLLRARITNEVGTRAVVSGTALVEQVRQWAADPASNHGVLFQAEDEANQPPLKLAAREHADPAFRPRLVLLPAPGGAAGLAAGLAALALLARRRARTRGPGARAA